MDEQFQTRPEPLCINNTVRVGPCFKELIVQIVTTEGVEKRKGRPREVKELSQGHSWLNELGIGFIPHVS